MMYAPMLPARTSRRRHPPDHRKTFLRRDISSVAALMCPKTCPSYRAGARKSLRCKEAPVGIEPTNRGFADLCLTTWLRRRAMQRLNLGGEGSAEKPQTL